MKTKCLIGDDFGCREIEVDFSQFDGINDTLETGIVITPNCPCHNEPCLWTSYNQALWKEPKQDHYSCPVTKEKVNV